jgi:homoaconitase/3-isopropylmalate dehydratase large subunit
LKTIWILFLAIILSCQSGKQNSSIVDKAKGIAKEDTLVVSVPAGPEMAGSAFRERATNYFVVHGRDTSDFRCVFAESNEGGKVRIFMKTPYSDSKTSYRQRMDEMKRILPVAAKEYNFDSLISLSLGRLVETGDLAVKVTREYIGKYGNNYNLRLKDYKPVADFLKESELGKDLDTLFLPFSVTVKRIVIEKLFFTTREELLRNGTIEYNISAIPYRILDCITWVQLGKK